MRKHTLLLIVAFIIPIFALDAVLAQQQDGFDAWLNRKNDEYDSYLNRNFDDWGKQKRDEYARWKERNANFPDGAPQQGISSFIEQGFAPSSSMPSTSGNTTTTSGNTTITSGNTTSGNMPGVNMPGVTATATTANTTDAQQTRHAATPMKVWVVIVGIAEYNRYQMSLNFTKDDAYRMYAFYKSAEGGSLPDEQITLLLDINASRQNVLKALENMYQKAGKDDAIIFYFAGHGGTGFFCLYEYAGVCEEYKGMLAHAELNNIFGQSQARYKYIIVDACHSGSLVEYVLQGDAEQAAEQGRQEETARSAAYYQAFEKKSKGLVMMLSSMNEEYSLEIQTIRQGAFTYNFLQGLKGEADTNKDNIVSVIELYDYVEEKVRDYTSGKQNPVLAGDYDNALPIAIIRK